MSPASNFGAPDRSLDLLGTLPVEPPEQQRQQGRKRCIFRISALVLLFVGVAASAVAV
ncbi:unnamed protein product, partial [Chrysoparadoxa australica]